MVLDQLDRLVVDDGVDQLVQGLGHDFSDLLDGPATTHVLQVLPHSLHLIVVGAAGEVDELGVGAAEHGPPVDQAASIERSAERQGARPGDDGLVEVEEGSGAGHLAHNTAPGRTRRGWAVRVVLQSWFHGVVESVALRSDSGTRCAYLVLRGPGNAWPPPPGAQRQTAPALPPAGVVARRGDVEQLVSSR